MRSASALSLAWVVVGALAASCGGTEFGQDTAQGDAGSDTGGATSNDGGAPGTAGTTSQSMAGETSEGGGTVTVGPGGAPGAAGQPDVSMCGGAVPPPDEPGDCKQSICKDGSFATEVALDDVPPPKGMCDVASCSEAGPKWTDDNAKCTPNKTCNGGACQCRPCPNGSLPKSLDPESCFMPVGVTASANHVMMGTPAANAVDGTTEKTWNAGQNTGTLTLTLASPQPMTTLVVYVTGVANANMGAKTISMAAKIERTGATTLNKNGVFTFSTMAPTGPIRIELGEPSRVTKLTLDFTSPTSWIAVNEAMFVMCSAAP